MASHSSQILFVIAAFILVVSTCTTIGSSLSVSGSSSSSGASSNWVTYHKDLSRDGYDNTSSGPWPPKLSWTSKALDGSIYAEPLIYNGLTLVATENNSVYALNETNGNVIWHTNFGAPVPSSDLPCGDINPSGITSTPAIDPTTGVLYTVAYLYRGASNPPLHTLFGVNVHSGKVLFKRHANPVGVDPRIEQQRGALAIANGVVYIPYGGLDGDCGNYHGYVVGVPENGSSTFQYKDPTGSKGGIWGPSGPSVASSGNLFVATGNSVSTTKFDFGDAVIELSPNLKEVSYFAPKNWAFLNANDLDLGSVGPAILGSSGLIFQIGKQGIGYLLNTTHLGGIGGQLFSKRVCSSGNGAFGGIAYANQVVYVPCTNGVVALKVHFGAKPSFSILWSGPQFRAGPPIVSGNVVWSVDLNNAILYALSPTNGTSLYSHSIGSVQHFITPTSANNRIFVAAGDTVYAFNI